MRCQDPDCGARVECSLCGTPPRSGIREKLVEFHRAINVPVLEAPTVPADERVRLRMSLILEECIEFLEACILPGDQEAVEKVATATGMLWSAIERGTIRVDLPEAADALADIAYVVEGANLEFGIDSGPVLNEVHRTNMAKVNGPVSPTGKRLKPPGWTPPDIEGVLARQRTPET